MSTQQYTMADALTDIGEKVRRTTADRDDLILAAVAEGMSHREVARAVGLSHTAVQSIVKRRQP